MKPQDIKAAAPFGLIMRRRTDFLLLAGLAVLITLSSAGTWLTISRAPWDGVTLTTKPVFREKEHRAEIDVHPNSPAERAGLRTGDTVFEIDGIDVADTPRLSEHLAATHHDGSVAKYVVARGSSWKRVNVPRERIPQFVPVPAQLLYATLVALPYLLVGFFTHWKRAGDVPARLLNLICLAFVQFSLFPRLAVELPSIHFSAVVAMSVGLAAMPPLLLHFALVFPHRHRMAVRHRWLVPAIYLFPIACMAVLVATDAEGPAGGVAMGSVVTAYMFYVPAGFWVFVASYRRSEGEEMRQLRWPVWGLAMALAGSLIWSLLGQSNFTGPDRELQLGFNPTAFALVPITIAIGILKYRLFDIDVVIRRTITYTLVTVIIVALTFGVSAAVGRLIVAADIVSGPTGTVVSTLIVALLFAPIRQRVQRRVDTHFSRGRMPEADALRQIHELIETTSGLESLFPEAAGKLQQIFNSRAVVIFRFQSGDREATPAAAIGFSETAAASLALRADSSVTRSLVNLDRSAAPPAADAAVMVPARARLVAPLRSRDEVLGVIMLGARISDERYDESDERLLTGIAAQIGLAVENHRLRERSAAEAEWHALDRMSRLAFVAASRLTGEEVDGVSGLVRQVRDAIVAAGASLPDANLHGAVDRLLRMEAIALDRGRLRIIRRNWLNAADCSKPLAELSSNLRDRIGAYEIVEKIAGGGMGEVFRGINVHDGSVAALKLLPPLDSHTADSRRRFEREGAIVSALSHPNIVRLLERGEHDNRLYLAMELIEGETLASRIYAPTWRAADAVDVALQISSALAALHGAGVVHRDVKPSNIMITNAGRAVLLDFGLARGVTSRTVTASSRIIGSLPYMSPEQLQGEGVDARTDVWSFAVVLYEMLLKRRPWRANDPARLAIEITSTPVDCSPLQTLVNEPLMSVIREGLATSPELRIRDGAELRRRLRHAVAMPFAQAGNEDVASSDEPTLSRVAATAIVRPVV